MCEPQRDQPHRHSGQAFYRNSARPLCCCSSLMNLRCPVFFVEEEVLFTISLHYIKFSHSGTSSSNPPLRASSTSVHYSTSLIDSHCGIYFEAMVCRKSKLDCQVHATRQQSRVHKFPLGSGFCQDFIQLRQRLGDRSYLKRILMNATRLRLFSHRRHSYSAGGFGNRAAVYRPNCMQSHGALPQQTFAD